MAEEVTDEEIKRIVNGFKRRIDYFKCKPSSKEFKTEQAAFVAGALYALNKQCTGFVICVNSGRNILEHYSKFID